MTDVFGLWLESLDVEKVRGESFYTQAHRDVMRDHEARKRVEAIMRQQTAQAKGRRKRQATSKRARYVFTERQLEIAMNVLKVD